MEGSGLTETEAGVDLSEEAGDLDYSTPIASRSASPNRYEEDWSTVATFQGPITYSSESMVVILRLSNRRSNQFFFENRTESKSIFWLVFFRF